MLVITSPGQGAQKPGFLAPWLEVDTVAELVADLSDAAAIDIAAHGTTSDAATIRDTAVAQPLLVAASIVTHSVLFGSLSTPAPDFYAGHSVGEVGAAAHAGVLGQGDAMRFVKARSTAMARAASAHDTTMAAVVGGARAEVMEAIRTAGATPANINGAAQVVAAGSREQIDALMAAAPARVRIIPLDVAGAFHSPYMEPARDELAARADDFSVQDPRVPLISNADGALVTSGQGFFDSLVSQVAHTVNWAACMSTMEREGVTGILELAPAGTLTGLAKRDFKSAARFDLNTPDQLDDARAFVAEHAGATAQEA